MKRKRANIVPHNRSTEYPTPTKLKVQGTVKFLEAKGLLKKNANTPIPYKLPTKDDIYNFFKVT